MCKIYKRYTNSKTFTGYKVVVRVGKRIYSPFTGIEYKKGNIPHVNIKCVITDDNGPITERKWALLMDSVLYRPDYDNKTSVIIRRKDAEWLLRQFCYKPWIMKLSPCPLEIVEMTISGDLHNSDGCWGGGFYNAITGSNIVKIKKIKHY
jgi:hypothetical protein